MFKNTKKEIKKKKGNKNKLSVRAAEIEKVKELVGIWGALHVDRQDSTVYDHRSDLFNWPHVEVKQPAEHIQ